LPFVLLARNQCAVKLSWDRLPLGKIETLRVVASNASLVLAVRV
jgi:hypothetical protein